ncbi:META domain-containing protein [Mesonia aestuariivivens]|uniref:META domain-containing protein n=1 Tax=Mesonia aestuariivivens TaxID=2796128 RepID=A0ABS6W478_9FLAO|nr:META domain-containing protein [Mesonia aestuariivivens]MBW2961889.1 META domain-containing protein [Mesonia aestuariivivens]
MKLKLFVLFFAALSISSCKDVADNSTKTLMTSEYLVEKIGENNIEKYKLTLNFNIEENKVNGFSGCNQYYGSLKTSKENKVEFGNIGSTRMMCEEKMQLENRFLETLQQTEIYELSSEKLLLKNEEGKVIIEAKKKN